MSIIHEALKKTESTASQYRYRYQPHLSLSWMKVLYGVIVVFLASILLHHAKSSHQLHSIKVAAPTHQKSAKTLAVPHLSLNGVFISEKIKMAMINNHMYKTGDLVEGMKIISIRYQRVVLADGERKIVLNNS